VPSLGGRLHALIARRPPAAPVPIAERFALFRAIGAANDAFLEQLARLTEASAGRVAGLDEVRSLYETMSARAATMVDALVRMAGGRYRTLRQRYEELDREVAREVLKGRPIEYGQLILWPGGDASLRTEEAGPKGARLAEITAMGPFDVPPFFVVSSHAYRLFMGATGLQDLVAETLAAANHRDHAAVAGACRRIRAAIAAAEVPLALLTAMHEAYARLTAGDPSPLGAAVRSSAVVEDGTFSFAGQFESVLNVQAIGLSSAYRRVVASKYRPETVGYAAAAGYLDDDVAMPVIVMRMVEPVASGVAYSQDPEAPDCVVVSAVRGLAAPLVAGTGTPARFVYARSSGGIEPRDPDAPVRPLRGGREGGAIEGREPTAAPPVDDAHATLVAHAALALESRFGAPQDVEWALDAAGALHIVQSRPLRRGALPPGVRNRGAPLGGARALVVSGTRAAGGIACGKVVRAAGPLDRDLLEPGSVLVVPSLDPRLAQVVGRACAIVSAAGSPTGHMATIAREFALPCIVGAGEACARLLDGALVTVDAWNGKVYEGRVAELLDEALRPREVPRLRDPVHESLQALVERVAPLTLTDPDSPRFRPRNCTTLHDVARFVHQRAMEEMFAIDTLPARERRQAHHLAWGMPMEVRVLDLGGGLGAGHGKSVTIAEVVSIPLLALLEGMTDPRVRWSGPVGFDLRGFVSVVVRSAADDQRYGQPAYALCSSDYAHFASRLAYHFATVDALCGRLVNENYARFRFYGGAAVSERREWRAHFLATVLGYNGFLVTTSGDRVDAVLGKRRPDTIEESLVMLGRLMVAARQLDMVMDSATTAELFANAFLSGDYGFDTVRREPPR
jgi:pyruvate, water dikinase